MSDEYVYTLDPPSNDPILNKRLGYRTPRSILLPMYLGVNEYFTDFMDAIDYVFDGMVDKKTEILGNLRNMWVTNPTLESTQIANSTLIPFSAWSQPERDLLVKQVNALGMKLQSAGVISNDSYQMISRWVGMYWFEKGTQAFIDFINYTLSSRLSVTKLWTEDYQHFYAEDDPIIGTPIWEGGTWYPTTHVSIVASGGLQQLDVKTLVAFFYEIANYNLVLQSVDLSYDMYVVDRLEKGHAEADIVAMGLWAQSVVVMSNLFQYGADSPLVFDLSPNITVNAYSPNPAQTDLSGTYILSQPTAWVMDPNTGFKIPAYTSEDQQLTEAPTLPMTFCGNEPASDDLVNMIFGPVSWIPVPGSTRSDARIPVFSSVPVLRTGALSNIPTQIVGNLRGNLLCNPTGWTEVVPGSGQYTPYWT